jgi:hypothetical protein
MSEEPASLSARAFREAYVLWRGIGELSVTAEAVGWLSLLSKTLNVAHELALNTESASAVGLSAAERLMIELHIQVHTVCRPLIDAGEVDLESEIQTQETRRALQMYAAWCIRSERELLDELSDKRLLEELFEPDTARGLIKSLGAQREAYEKHFGAIPEDSDQELALDRGRLESGIRSEKRDLALIANLNLQPLLNEMEAGTKRARAATNSRIALTFAALYAFMRGDPVPSARKQFAEARIRFMYPVYSRDSLQLHGSSLNLLMSEGTIGPRLSPATTASPDDLASILRDIVFRLSILRQFLPA